MSNESKNQTGISMKHFVSVYTSLSSLFPFLILAINLSPTELSVIGNFIFVIFGFITASAVPVVSYLSIIILFKSKGQNNRLKFYWLTQYISKYSKKVFYTGVVLALVSIFYPLIEIIQSSLDGNHMMVDLFIFSFFIIGQVLFLWVITIFYKKGYRGVSKIKSQQDLK